MYPLHSSILILIQPEPVHSLQRIYRGTRSEANRPLLPKGTDCRHPQDHSITVHESSRVRAIRDKRTKEETRKGNRTKPQGKYLLVAGCQGKILIFFQHSVCFGYIKFGLGIRIVSYLHQLAAGPSNHPTINNHPSPSPLTTRQVPSQVSSSALQHFIYLFILRIQASSGGVLTSPCFCSSSPFLFNLPVAWPRLAWLSLPCLPLLFF